MFIVTEYAALTHIFEEQNPSKLLYMVCLTILPKRAMCLLPVAFHLSLVFKSWIFLR